MACAAFAKECAVNVLSAALILSRIAPTSARIPHTVCMTVSPTLAQVGTCASGFIGFKSDLNASNLKHRLLL